MKVLEVSFTPLNKTYYFDPQDHTLEVDNYVIVKTELGVEIGKVLKIKDIDDKKNELVVKPILRKANQSDIDKMEEKNKFKGEHLEVCRQTIKKYKLDMKIVDVHYSFDGGKMTFYFTANNRIDFRDLVKDLTKKFQRSIRLHQIGVRDEARSLGGVGCCGEILCCHDFLGKLSQVNSDFASTQHVSHRGGDRLTGLCSRLKCCLNFEQEMYEEITKELPEVGRKVRTDKGRGVVISQHPLKHSVKVRLNDADKTIIEVKIKENINKQA